MGHASEKLRTPEAYWLFKRVADSVKCLCILELANGDYWIIDSPTGTYMSGHADRWHWPCRSGVLGPGLRSRVRSEVTRTHLTVLEPGHARSDQAGGAPQSARDDSHAANRHGRGHARAVRAATPHACHWPVGNRGPARRRRSTTDDDLILLPNFAAEA